VQQHEPSDDAVLSAVADGDREAFGVLVTRYQEPAFRAAYVIVRDSAAAEDIAQDAFIRAYRGLGRFEEGRPFRPWLLRIVTNLALNEVRARSRRGGLWARLSGAPPEVEPAPERAVEARERHESMVDAISELPLDDRVVLYLRYFLELPEAEIAVAIGKRPGTVKSRLSRASTRLRDVIEKRYPALQPEATRTGAFGE
jgi:RNA polymerase sigma factor (sigma-70 family)